MSLQAVAILKERVRRNISPLKTLSIHFVVSRLSLLVVAQVDGVIDFLAGRIESCDKHHLVGVGCTHDLVVNVLHIFGAVDRHIINIGDNETVFEPVHDSRDQGCKHDISRLHLFR